MDALTLTLTAAALLVPLDLVRSGFSLERARAHDRAILRLLAIATLVVTAVDLVAGLVLALGVLGYWREASLRNLLLAAGLAGIWLAAPLLQPTAWILALGWLALALLEAAVTLWFWGALRGWWLNALMPLTMLQIRMGMPPTSPNTITSRLATYVVPDVVGYAWHLRPLSGFRGQHTLFAAGLALLLPLAWALYPALGVCWLLMLIWISSWVSVLAGLAGLVVVEPRLTPYIAGVILLGLVILTPRIRYDRASWLDVLPRGDSLDSVKERWHSWRFLIGTMTRWPWTTWLTGRGWAGPNQDLLRARALKAVKQGQGTSHNDVLDLVYTSGVLGLALLIVLGWRLAHGFYLGDPWSAVVVVGVVIALGSSALRYPSIGLVWWIACAFVGAGR
jgi:hypothetical protein